MRYKWIGWCNEDNHDKVWGVILLEDKPTSWTGCTYARCVIFWGRRGKKLSTKLTTDDSDLQTVLKSKMKKGYKEIDSARLTTVYPEFENDLEKTAVYALLSA